MSWGVNGDKELEKFSAHCKKYFQEKNDRSYKNKRDYWNNEILKRQEDPGFKTSNILWKNGTGG